MAKSSNNRKVAEVTISDLKIAIDGLASAMKTGFAKSDKRMDGMEVAMKTGFAKSDKRMDGMEVAMKTGFVALDKKIESFDKKIENEVGNLAAITQNQFMEMGKNIAELKIGQERIEANLVGVARNIDLMDLRAEVEILKRKV